jgi:stage IV sporulation protein B
VIDTCEVEMEDGTFVNPTLFKLKTGDYIREINDNVLQEKEDMISFIKNSNGKEMKFLIIRNGEERVEYFTPVKSRSGEYMLGVWIKDDLAGVGTITYIDRNGEFAALGHGLGDGETKALLEVKQGDIYVSDIIGIQKGKAGEPGEVKGVIKYGMKNHIGNVEINSTKGIYGTIDEDDKEKVKNQNLYQVAPKRELEIGDAQIISEISGERKYYNIEITYVDYLAVDTNKGIYIKIIDEELLDLTGGIVQGMSGSPILQNGKLVGAVTHVLVNDPTSGYGIFIENMLDAAYEK